MDFIINNKMERGGERKDVPSRSTLVIRPLQIGDYDKGICRVLGQLTEVGAVTKPQFESRFREFQERADTYHVWVIEDVERSAVVATASLVVEKKIIHDCGKCGHIEDVVVDSAYRGLKLGLELVEKLREVAEQNGCYKLVLDCTEKNATFYEKAGFKRREIQMVRYLPVKNRL